MGLWGAWRKLLRSMRLMLVGAVGLVFATACMRGADPGDTEVESGPEEIEPSEALCAEPESTEGAKDATSKSDANGGPRAGKAKGR